MKQDIQRFRLPVLSLALLCSCGGDTPSSSSEKAAADSLDVLLHCDFSPRTIISSWTSFWIDSSLRSIGLHFFWSVEL